MSDLVAFLKARLDEDERVALAAGEDDTGRTWTADDNGYPGAGAQVLDGGGYHVIFDEGGTAFEQVTHIARHNPARVLREVEAKREIVDMHADCGSGLGYCDDGGHGGEGGCGTVRYLAAVYGDHPDYREDWTP